MGYSAIEKMRQEHLQQFKKDVGPFVPRPIGKEAKGMDLKSAALRFIEKRCEDLRFDSDKEKLEINGHYEGKSAAPNQIPYNMQMDLERLCMKNELAKFIDSGVAVDAYTVYFSYMEMFMGAGGRSQSIVELLSEFESNASSLVMSHRDHYSHSVYVFALGLAIYETNSWFRKVFSKAYGFRDKGEGRESAHAFLEYWGLAALFHDIGYPFEIPFEQVMAYYAVRKKEDRGTTPYISYRNVNPLLRIGEEDGKRLQELYGKKFTDVVDLLGHVISGKIGKYYRKTEQETTLRIRSKPGHPEENSYFMDHAFFSASGLYQELVRVLGGKNLQKYHIDALTAIMLHNSLFKFAFVGYKSDYPGKPLKAEWHPLAWLLMLCDELQCWDRTAYGRNSRDEMHPMAVDFNFSGEAIRAVYYYDSAEKEKVKDFYKKYETWTEEGSNPKTQPRLKAYSDMAEEKQRFCRDIGQIVDLKNCPLTVKPSMRKADRRVKHTYLSTSNFLHIYNFAVALHGRYAFEGKEDKATIEEMEKEFNSLSLEYKISNINQVRAFDMYLNAIDCFYTDRPVDFDMVTAFSDEMIDKFAPMEHERWIREHQSMGWTAGNEYETLPLDPGIKNEKAERKNLRERMRMHKLTLNADADDETVRNHYSTLPEDVQKMDYLPFNSLLKLLKKYDGARIYRLR